MKRSVRRALAIGLGLVMGWCAAGFLPGSTSVSSPTLAQEQAAGDGHDHASTQASTAANPPATAPAAAPAPRVDVDKAGAVPAVIPALDTGEASPAATQPDAGPEAGPREPGSVGTRAEAGHTKSPSQLAAEALRPGASDLGWYGKVVLAIIGLFVLALVVGSLAVKFRSAPPTDPPGTGHGG